jgi:glycosyltransferase involved in cell wall biosynthesis
MAHIGLDLEQFVIDPQCSGIQRVLQQLALKWPIELVSADFVVPYRGQHLLLAPAQAGELITRVFSLDGRKDARRVVAEMLETFSNEATAVDSGRLISLFSTWLLPEVSYCPSVLERFRLFGQVMPACMIGYDILPMSDPGNYRFIPGTAANVSEYFRLLAQADSLVCISQHSREEILRRLRRGMDLPTEVAYPGGDHVRIEDFDNSRALHDKGNGRVRFLRVGTLEARKRPLDLVRAFQKASTDGMQAELLFVGRPSASDLSINDAVRAAASEGIGIQWLEGASDGEVQEMIANADVFLALGTEGFGIPVVEAISLGIPVLFDGIQPAAEAMLGHGAEPLLGVPKRFEDWAEALKFYAEPIEAKNLGERVRPDQVPSWSDFAERVALAALRG